MKSLSRQHLLLLKSWAREKFLEIRANEILEHDLDHGDRLAVAFFRASICMMVHQGLISDPDVDFGLEIPDLDPIDEMGWTEDPGDTG
jgi:hypothetical protein